MKGTILYFPRAKNNPNRVAYVDQLNKIGYAFQMAETNISVREARRFIDFWKPVCCIVNNDRLPTDVFKGMMTVFAHRNPTEVPRGSILISLDEKEIAKRAAQELLRLNLAAYGFVPDPAQEYWCQERERAFLQAMKVNFRREVTTVCPLTSASSLEMQISIARWLRSLPRPVGIFAANDAIARLVANTCLHDHLSVPQDVAIIGVDNITAICEDQQISISSIDDNDTEIIQRVLESIVRGLTQRRRTTLHIRTKPGQLVRRASTMRFTRADAKVSEAVELIRQQACNGLTAKSVTAIFNCSRRMAEIRFRTVTGLSILEAIQSVRLDRVKTLLAEDRHKTDVIAAQCGYSSWSSVYRLLKKDTASAMV